MASPDVCLNLRAAPAGDVTVPLRPAPDTGKGYDFAALFASLMGSAPAPRASSGPSGV